MASSQSFSVLMHQLQAGDQDAAAMVFRRFARRLIGLATGRLDHQVRGKTDPEDVVQSVFRSFFSRQRDGQFDLPSWDSLWDILVIITLRKCCNRVEYHHAACRDVRREIAGLTDSEDSADEIGALSREPTPAEAVQLTELVECLLQMLERRERTIVELRLQGHSIIDVCAQVACSERKVYRVLKRARLELERLEEGSESV
jgi:RNA polymerase sigma-70 factor (ECF subfamily)